MLICGRFAFWEGNLQFREIFIPQITHLTDKIRFFVEIKIKFYSSSGQ